MDAYAQSGNMKLRIQKLREDAHIPTYAHVDDAGMDIRTPERVVVPAGERVIIPTGLAFELPPQTVGLVWDKSGLAARYGITTLSGVLDAGYRGELKIVALNTSRDDYTFESGDKVTQLLIQPIVHPEIEETDALGESDRGTGGFGSTGR